HRFLVLEASGHVGGNVSIHCFSSWSPVNVSELHSTHFCKGVCSGENAIIQMEMTSSAVTRDGRYSMESNGGDGGAFTVTINRLRTADAGSYLCGMARTLNVTYQEVRLKVVDGKYLARSSRIWCRRRPPVCGCVRGAGSQKPRLSRNYSFCAALYFKNRSLYFQQK
uniref:Immunoglobulin V-set domain-containing protein n=1 Tax=Xiphophorus maculatus TaxID=8083 RepID=A0A3B5RD12_XIPMA